MPIRSRPRGRIGCELIGCDDRFWQLGDGRPRRLPEPREIVLNRPLAERLGVPVGDAVLLRLPALGAIPADSALGQEAGDRPHAAADGQRDHCRRRAGRFGLRPTQHLPLNAYVPLGLARKSGSISRAGPTRSLLAGRRRQQPPAAAVPRLCRPQLADYGLSVERTPLGYWNITSDRMLLDPATRAGDSSRRLRAIPIDSPRRSAGADLPGQHAGLQRPRRFPTRRSRPSTSPIGRRWGRFSREGKPLPPLGPNEIALNSWAADQLHAKLGDTVRLTYFEPESIDGQVREKTVALRLAAIVQLAGAADDRGLVPAVKGMTDELTMANWDPPFPFDAKRIRPADEEYWNRYGPTPKAFVSLATGRRLWGSRFGQTTSIRVALSTAEGWALQCPVERTIRTVALTFAAAPTASRSGRDGLRLPAGQAAGIGGLRPAPRRSASCFSASVSSSSPPP